MSEFITLQEAVEMTTLYRAERETILAPPFKNQNVLALSETFSRGDIDLLLSKPGCTGIRVYYGMKPDHKVYTIIVAVNSLNQDILPAGGKSGAVALSVEDDIVERGTRCPPDCPPDSPLTGGE